ncbi:MAG: c-type cytochrome, partial [Limisphaerales bacterium]
ILLAAFDPSPSVREAAFRAFQVMSDRRNPIPDVGGETLEMWMSDPNPAVRFHLAYSLGQGDYRRMTDALVAILKRDAADRWTRAVVLSGLKERMHEFAEQWFATEWDDSEHSVALAFEMGRVYGAEDANGREVVLRHALSASADGTGWQAALLSGLLEAGNKQVRAWVRKPGNDRVLEIERHCRTNALDTTLALYQRTAAIRLLGEFVANTSETLLQIVTGSHPKEFQIAAARSLVKVSELALPEKVFNQWREMSPELREVFVGYLVSKPERAVMLLDSVERGLVPVWNINANRRQVLLRHRNEAVKERAEKLLGAQGGGDRSNVFEDYKPVLQSKGDALSGRKIFLNICASCHQHGKEGYPVGPDLSGLKNQPAEAVLYHILMPDAEIYAGYENYEVETKAGEQFNGLLVEENDSTIMLVRALGERMSIPRADIARLRTSASSLMPAELEKAMTRQELADLLAFLRSSL